MTYQPIPTNKNGSITSNMDPSQVYWCLIKEVTTTTFHFFSSLKILPLMYLTWGFKRYANFYLKSCMGMVMLRKNRAVQKKLCRSCQYFRSATLVWYFVQIYIYHYEIFQIPYRLVTTRRYLMQNGIRVWKLICINNSRVFCTFN